MYVLEAPAIVDMAYDVSAERVGTAQFRHERKILDCHSQDEGANVTSDTLLELASNLLIMALVELRRYAHLHIDPQYS
jgi:hypothetical protein